MSESQRGESYLCSCGETFDDVKKFRSHLMRGSLKDGKGSHKSQGRINTQTGELVMGPWEERTDEEKRESKIALNNTSAQQKVNISSRKEFGTGKMITTQPEQATEMRFVPRVLNATYTPIMRMAQVAATKEWGWRADMPIENFIDTIFFHFFSERGIELGGYVVVAPQPNFNGGNKANDGNNGNHGKELTEVSDGS